MDFDSARSRPYTSLGRRDGGLGTPPGREKLAQNQEMFSSQRGVPGRQEGKIPALGKLRKEQIIKKETRALETKQDPRTRARSGVWSGHKRACWLN